MNYYNPYFYNIPTPMVATARTGLFSRLFGGLTFSKFINGTQRALNFANQAIPFVKQVKPMIGNARTMFKVMSEFKKSEYPKSLNRHSFNNNDTVNTNTKNNYSSNNGPTFFM